MKKTILFILPNLHAGGAERVASLLINHLDRKRFIPKLLLFQKEGVYLEMLREDVEIIEVCVSRIRYSIFKVLKTIRKYQPDIVFSGYGELNAFISPFLPFFEKIKFIARETNVVSEHVKRKEILFFYRFYNNFDKIIAQSDDMEEDLIKNIRINPEKIVKINNPIDMDFIREKLKEGESPEEYFMEKKNVLAVGSLNRRKGFDLLLKVFSHLRDQPIHLFIVGEGPERKNLLRLKQKLDLQNVSFLGMRANPFVYMKHADLFVLPSRYEGFPNVLLEANACGAPIVANHCRGGIDEIIQPGVNGEYGAIEDGRTFANLILETLGRKDTYHDLSQFIQEKYDVNKIVSLYSQVFEFMVTAPVVMKKKILFRTTTLSGGGGVEKSLLTILNHIDYSKYEIDLLVDFNYNNDAFLDRLPKEIKMYCLAKGNKFSFQLLMNGWIRKSVKRLRSMIGENSLTIRHVYSSILRDKLYDIEIGFVQDVVPQLIKSPLKSKKIAWLHVDFKRNIHKIYGNKQLQKIISSFKGVDKIVTVSKGAEEALLSLCPELEGKTQHIYNPIDLGEVIERSREKDLEEKDKELHLIAVGRLMWEKGFDRLINVCHKLKKEGFGFKLFILGEGPLKEKLTRLIYKLGLETHVKLLGFKTSPYAYISAADVFVMSSYVEGFAYVVLEALILNKVIVSTDVAGPRELLKDGTLGLLVENSEEGLYEGLKNILSDDTLRISFMEKEKDFDMFDPKKTVRQIEALIDSL